MKKGAELDSSEVMTLRQAAEYLNFHVNTIRRLVNRGELPAFRMGDSGHWRIRPADIDQWIVQQQERALAGGTASKPERRGRPRKK